MKKYTNKRGFTIVELIIVIAVIATLAAVLIPTFGGLIKQAQEAADKALVESLNKSLALDVDNQHNTMHEALVATAKQGFVVEKIGSKVVDNEILWDSRNDCFVYLKDGTINYIPDSKTKDVGADEQYVYWKITKDEVPATSDYSVYLARGNVATVTLSGFGFDAGDNTSVQTITYQGASKAKEIVIRTNSADTMLTVNGYIAGNDGDTIKHYGTVGQVVANVAMHCYYEFGTSSYMQLKQGKVVINKSASVKLLYVAPENNATVEVATNGGVVENAYAATEITNAGNVTIEKKDAGEIEKMGKEALNIGAGRVVQLGDTDNYISLDELKNAWNNNDDVNNAVVKVTEVFNIIADVDMSGKVWEDGIGSSTNTSFSGTINGNGHTIKNFTFNSSTEVGGFIQNAATVTIKDLSFENSSIVANGKVGTVVGYCRSGVLKMENVKVLSGSVNSEQYAGGLVGKSMADTYIKDCSNNADVTAKVGPEPGDTAMVAAGIVADMQGNKVAIFDNCVNTGTILAHECETLGDVSTIAAGIVGYFYQPSEAGYNKLALVNCSSEGTIRANSAKNNYEHALMGCFAYTKDKSFLNIYVKGCKVNNKVATVADIGNYDRAEAYSILKIENGTTSNLYYCASGGFDSPISEKKTDGVWIDITSKYTSTVEYSWESKTLNFTYATK